MSRSRCPFSYLSFCFACLLPACRSPLLEGVYLEPVPLSLCTAPSDSTAPSPTHASVRVVLSDTRDRPIVGGRVDVRRYDDQFRPLTESHGRTLTATANSLVISSISPGVSQVIARAIGYAPQRIFVALAPGQCLGVRLHLRRDPIRLEEVVSLR
jgi:hypothetical protein